MMGLEFMLGQVIRSFAEIRAGQSTDQLKPLINVSEPIEVTPFRKRSGAKAAVSHVCGMSLHIDGRDHSGVWTRR
jgi:hypothetical protein